MKLLLDQGLPLSAASLLTQQGFNTIHVSEVEKLGWDLIKVKSNNLEVLEKSDLDLLIQTS